MLESEKSKPGEQRTAATDRNQGRWLWGAGSCLVLVVFSYFVLDRPLATFVHGQFHDEKLFAWLTHFVDALMPLAVIALIVAAAATLMRQPLGRPSDVALRAALGLLVAIALKDELKFLFGRTWPETWVGNNPSFFGNGTFGFHPLHGGIGYSSFPSGHMTETCTVMAVLWFCYPRFRWIYTSVALLVAIGLLGADFHWLSDVIAGAYLGTAVGVIAAKFGRDTPLARGQLLK